MTKTLDKLISRLNVITPTQDETLPEFVSQGVDHHEYSVCIFDKSLDETTFPIILTPEIYTTSFAVSKNYGDNKTKAQALCYWVAENIQYGKMKRTTYYRNSKTVFEDREGVCGEMAQLYIAMTRAIGIRSNYAHVTRDAQGKAVNHACAIVDLPGKFSPCTLVDPSRNSYDIQHLSYTPLNDVELLKHINP